MLISFQGKDKKSVRKGEHLKALCAATLYFHPQKLARLQADLQGTVRRSPPGLLLVPLDPNC